jgi:uncharacterized protein YkwD
VLAHVRTGLALTLVAAVLVALPAAAQARRSQRERSRVDRVERAVQRAVNSVRARVGLRTLRLDRRMSYGAALHSEQMARRLVAAHGAWGPRLGHFAGVPTVGEVIGWVGGGDAGQPGSVVAMWMRSPIHRAVLLSNRFGRIGVGRQAAPRARVTFFTVDVAAG